MEEYGKNLKDELKGGAAEKLLDQATQATQARRLAERSIELADQIMKTAEQRSEATGLKLQVEELRDQVKQLADPPEQKGQLNVEVKTIVRNPLGSSSLGDRRIANPR